MEPGQHIQEGKQVTDQFKLLKQNLLENKAAAKNRKQKWFHTIQWNSQKSRRVKKNTEGKKLSHTLSKNFCIQKKPNQNLHTE